MADRFPAGPALVVAGALAAVVLAGCGTPASTPPADGGGGGGAKSTSQASPGPGRTSAPSPTQSSAPERSVTATNLLTVDEVPLDDPISKKVVESPDGKGRSVSQSYICLPANGLASLGATSMVTRNFTFKIIDAEGDPYPKSPLKNKPAIYTQALQFPDEATAAKAAATYVGWMEGCPRELEQKGYTIDKAQSFRPTKVKVSGAHAKAAMVVYVPPGVSDAENLYWESAAVTQVKDRVMITIALSWGMDTPGSLDDSEGDFVHPEVILIEESATRLAA